MAATRNERLAYARGYNRARARSGDLWRHLLEICKGYRARLAEPALSHSCGDCRRWSRGHDSPRVMWGYCAADFDGPEPRMWADRNVGEVEQRRIVTQAAFGCVNWLPAESRVGVRAISEQDPQTPDEPNPSDKS